MAKLIKDMTPQELKSQVAYLQAQQVANDKLGKTGSVDWIKKEISKYQGTTKSDPTSKLQPNPNTTLTQDSKLKNQQVLDKKTPVVSTKTTNSLDTTNSNLAPKIPDKYANYLNEETTASTNVIDAQTKSAKDRLNQLLTETEASLEASKSDIPIKYRAQKLKDIGESDVAAKRMRQSMQVQGLSGSGVADESKLQQNIALQNALNLLDAQQLQETQGVEELKRKAKSETMSSIADIESEAATAKATKASDIKSKYISLSLADQEAAKKEAIDTIEQYSGNYAKAKQDILTDKDTSNDYLVPYIDIMRNRKVTSTAEAKAASAKEAAKAKLDQIELDQKAEKAAFDREIELKKLGISMSNADFDNYIAQERLNLAIADSNKASTKEGKQDNANISLVSNEVNRIMSADELLVDPETKRKDVEAVLKRASSSGLYKKSEIDALASVHGVNLTPNQQSPKQTNTSVAKIQSIKAQFEAANKKKDNVAINKIYLQNKDILDNTQTGRSLRKQYAMKIGLN